MPPGLEAEIVGNEALAFLTQQLFDHRMAPADDQQFAGGVEFGARITAIGGQLGERGEDIKLRHRRGGTAQARGFGGYRRTHIDKKLALDFQDALVGGEDLSLIFFQFR